MVGAGVKLRQLINEKSMSNDLKHVCPGLALIMLTLLFGVVLGISFGVAVSWYNNEHQMGELATHPSAFSYGFWV